VEITPDSYIKLATQQLTIQNVIEETNLKKKLEDKNTRYKIIRKFKACKLIPAELSLQFAKFIVFRGKMSVNPLKNNCF